MKVALLYHEIPPFVSGIGSYTYDLGIRLAKKKIQTIIITGHYKKDEIEIVNPYLKIYRLKNLNIAPRFLWFQLLNRNKIVRILEREKCTILHGQDSSCAMLFSHKKVLAKKVLTMHGTCTNDFREFLHCPLRYWTFGDAAIHFLGYPIWYFLEKTEIKNADRIVTFTNYIAESIKKQFDYPKEVEIIPQGIDLDKIEKLRESSKASYDNSIFFAGRLIWRKGIVYLMEAMKIVTKKLPEIKLKIFGDGPLKKYISQFVKKNKLENNVIIFGQTKLPDLISDSDKSYFAVLPSLFEAESIVMLEALVRKKTIIAFDLPFIKNTLQNNKNSILVEKNSKKLAEAIIKLIRTKRMRDKLGKEAYRQVLVKHSWKKILPRYLDIYKPKK